MTLIDLVPDTAYYVAVRSHPEADNIVWGWSPPSASTLCRTAASRTAAPHALARVGSAPSPRAVTLSWTPGVGTHGAGGHDVGVRVVGAANWTWERVAAGSSHTATGLGPGQAHEVVVRDRATGEVRGVGVGLKHTHCQQNVRHCHIPQCHTHVLDPRTREPSPCPRWSWSGGDMTLTRHKRKQREVNFNAVNFNWVQGKNPVYGAGAECGGQETKPRERACNPKAG